ncbi:MAG: hypothetical protein M3R17_09160 [Bacteroidota bacterium]|nr:hypothetical protein [Bacteroidota bacterium]
MKNLLFTLVFLLPFTLNAQLDKLRPGMSAEEFHKKFPTAIPDLNAMTSSIYETDTIFGIVGESRYTAVRDSVKHYDFRSGIFQGPNQTFPKADSADYLRLVRAGEELAGHYSDVFGAPTEQQKGNPRTQAISPFSAVWKKADVQISVIVHEVVEFTNGLNAPPPGPHEKKKKAATYVLEVYATGKSTKLRIDFQIGITTAQFRALMPSLASQVKNFPDCWMMGDTLNGHDTEWHFWLIDNILAGFSFDSYDGNTYGGTNKTAYPVLLKKAKQLVSEEQRSYGAPTLLQEPATDTYVPVKKVPGAFFYDDVYYNAEWEMDKGKILFIRLHENGGKGESFLHLEVYFGEKEN